MREHEIFMKNCLLEVKTIRLGFDSGETEIIWLNPVASKLRQLLTTKEMLRGLIIGKDVFVWDAYNAVHYTMLETLCREGYINENDNVVPFVISSVRDFNNEDSGWTSEDAIEVNGFYFAGGDVNHASFRRMLGVQ